MKIIATALAALLPCGHGTALSPLSRTPPVNEKDQVLFGEEESEIDPSNTLAEKHKNRRLLRSEERTTVTTSSQSSPNSKSSLEASLGQNNGYKFGAQNHESFVKHSSTRRLAQDWVLVATITSYHGYSTIVSETEIETCGDCKLSDDAINALDFDLLRFEPFTPSDTRPITYFDFSNKIFDGTALVEPCSTPWTLSETDALAGIFGGEETETCCGFPVCNFGRGHCGGKVKSAYGWGNGGACLNPNDRPVVGLSGAQYGSGVRIYVWSLPATTPPTASPTSSPTTLSPTTSPTSSPVTSAVAIGCFMEGDVGGPGTNLVPVNNNPVETCRAHCQDQGKPYMSFSCAGQGAGQYCGCHTESDFSSETERPSYECRGECTHSSSASCSGRSDDGSRVDTNCPGWWDGSANVSVFEGYSLGASWRTMIYPVEILTESPTMSPTSSPTTLSPTTSPTTSQPTLSPTHSPSSSPTYAPRLAKYLKIQLESSGSLSVNEVQVINESSTNVAVSFAVAVTMSSTDGGNVPANVVDGDTNTAARTLDESMPWLQIELAQETDISKVIIDSDGELSSARISLLDEEGNTVFAAEGSVLAAATNGSGALEINGPDFQNAKTSSPLEQSSNHSPDAIAPLSITGTINFDEVGMCEVEDMAGFIAATESVLAETACGDYSNCAVRIVSVCGVPVENIDMGTRKLQSSVGADYEYEVTLERACGTANCDDAQAVADQTFASVQQDINAAIQDGSFVAQLQTHTQGSSGSLATMLTNTTLTANMDRVVVVGSENSLYYPDWTKSNGGCKTGGGQPLYMTLAPLTWMETTLEDCCEKYYGWMLNECKGTSGGAPSGLWYPDWAGQDDTCKNDGNEPEYMASNPIAWMKSSKQDCCEANFIWMLNECLGSSSGPDDGATSKWFIDWDDYKCKRDCAVGTGPSCGGHAESWDELFDTRSACCSTKAAWNPTDCLVD